jgi:hypothetical protein
MGLACPALFLAHADVLGITRKFMGSHVVRHYYVKRQYDEATQVALGFLQFLRSDCEASLPANFLAQLDAAIGVSSCQCTHAKCSDLTSRVLVRASAWSACGFACACLIPLTSLLQQRLMRAALRQAHTQSTHSLHTA